MDELTRIWLNVKDLSFNDLSELSRQILDSADAEEVAMGKCVYSQLEFAELLSQTSINVTEELDTEE